SLIVNSLHKFKTGLSYAYDHFSENLNGKQYNRTENVPGVFFEYSYTNLEKLSAVAGLRADYHDQFGAFVTPRLHLKYMLTPNTVVRGSAGRGLRVANIFAEHMGILASSRTIKIMGDSTQSGFGLDPEIAWNYGVSLAHDFRLNYRGGVVSIDFYRTDFINQVILDLENDPTEAVFYNLAGESYSNSFQFQIDYEPIRKLEMRLAYRWYDVMTTYNNRLLSQPLISQHLTFLNAAYKTKSKWHFDYTIQWQGPKRIPNTSSNPENFQLDDFSPSFFLMNAQIAKSLGKSFQIYLGMENILHIRQMEPIISASQPFGPYFDSSLIWGPIFGRMAYIGLRYTFEKDKKDS
ncbi:MAG: TonB-dependent receptor, partial [Bacteroidetes bacterium]|nr:TonB-dependent receptor [Bacteroidota bacterium]